MRERAARVGEADCRKARLGLGAGEPESFGRKRRHGREQRAIEQPLVESANAKAGALPERSEFVGAAGEAR